MTAATLRRLVTLLAVLIAVWIGLSLIRSYRRDKAVTAALPRFNRASVDAITIARPADTFRFARQGDQWSVNGYATAAKAVSDLLDAASDTARGELVAESPSSYAELGVDSAGVRRITLSAAGKPLATLLVGKRSEDFSGAYLRLPGDANVYQIPGRLAEFADRALADWRDKTIVTLVPDSVARIDVARGRSSYTLTRADKTWKLGAAPADSGAVQRFLQQLAAISATGFATPAQADSANHAGTTRTVRITDTKGATLAAITFDSSASGVFRVRREGNPTVYTLDSYTVDLLTPADSTLRKKP